MNPPPSGATGKGNGDVHDLAPPGFATRALLSWMRLLASHRKLLTLILIAQAALFSACSAWIIWQPDVLLFFSSDSAEVRSVHQATGQSGLANQLHLDVHFTAPVDSQTLAAAAHDLAAALSATHQFRTIWTGADPNQIAADYAQLAAQSPLLLDDPHEIESRLSADYLQKRFADVRNHIGDPDGEILLRQLAADPLNLSDALAPRLRGLAPADSSASFQDGQLTTRDDAGRLHAMIIADPFSLPSDQKAAAATLAAANSAIAALRQTYPALEVWLIGPHRGYVENAQRIKTDVARISLLGTLAVALAIALFFRRLTTALLCLIPPIVGVGLALGLAGLAHITLPLILLGFAGLLCGSTTDYGILIITEARHLFAQNNHRWHPDIPALAARRTLAPISMSVATSVTGFAALALSASPGLCALGLFVAVATICIWLVTFLILPVYLGPWILPRIATEAQSTQRAHREATNERWRFGLLRAVGCILFLALTAYLAVAALHVRFNADPHSLDGSSARADEDAFAKVWGDLRNRGIILITKPTADEALNANQQIYDYLQDQKRDGLIAAITSAAPILPDQQTLQQRAEAWTTFWTDTRRDQLRSLLAAAATANNFKPAAFTPYADRIAALEIPSAQDRLASSPAALLPGLISSTPTSTTLATLVQMRSDKSLRAATAWGPELRLRYPGVVILSGNLLFFDATDRARAEGERLAPWCVLAILLPLLLYFRKLRKAWLVLTCLVVGFIWVLAAAQLLGGGLNLLSLVPILFTLGVAVDYGIYAATDTSSSENSPRTSATFLCALTTILGSGSLALAQHPALRWLGITLVAGITGGYLTSHFIVAPLARKIVPRPSGSAALRPRRLFSLFARFALFVFLVLLTLLLFIPPLTETFLTTQHPAHSARANAHPALQQLAPRTFQIGPSWMHYHPTSDGDSGLWEITLAGTPFDRGHAVSELAAPLDYRIETEMLDQLDTLLPNEFSRYLITRTFAANLITLPRYIPEEYQQEIYASATGAPDPRAYLVPAYPHILDYHALHDISQMLIDNPLIVPNNFACTGVISLPAYSAPQDGHLFLARNFDFEGGESFARQKSITYIIPPPGEGIPFAHVAWPGLAGCVTGINQQKIAIFLNAAATTDFRHIGTPTILMARDILQHGRSLDDAEKIIRRTQTFVSDIIVVADGKTGQARVFEKSPARLGTFDVTQSAVVANHLVTPAFAADPVNRARQEESTTAQRYARARQLLDRLHQNITPATLASLLRDKNTLDDKPLGLGNRNAIDGLIACHSVIIDATTGQLWVAAWPNAEGEFIGIDILAMLNRAAANPNLSASASPPTLPPDKIMSDGQWQRWLASRTAAQQSESALRMGESAAALEQAQAVIHDNPDFFLGHELAGRALLMKGDRIAAKLQLQEALDRDPPYAKIRTALKDLIQKCDTH